MESDLHKKLKKEAVDWLNQLGCSIVAEEVSFRGDLFDVVGIKDNGISYCIEAKATQEDLDKNRQVKNVYSQWRNSFNFCYLILPEGRLNPDWEWLDWGIIRVPFANYELEHKLSLHIEKKSKRFESLKTFPETIEIIMAIAKRLTNQIYYQKSGAKP